MNVFEYLLGDEKNPIYFDEEGNAHIDNDDNFYEESGMWNPFYLRLTDMFRSETCQGPYFLPEKEYKKLEEIQVIIPDKLKEWDSDARRPYYRMRGKSITTEQAFDIIRRTDGMFYNIRAIREHEDFFTMMHFDNSWFPRKCCASGYGYIHFDGTVGINTTTNKLPEMYELMQECSSLLVKFPYLDFVMGVSKWDEAPAEVWGSGKPFYTEEYDKKFLDSIDFFIHVHDKKIEVTENSEKYEEYEKQYGSPREKFEREICPDTINQSELIPYLKRCIESYGLDPEKELRKIL